MARIRVRYYGPLRELTGAREEKISIDDQAGLAELIDAIIKDHGKKFEDYIFDNKKRVLKDGFVCAVNGDTILANQFGEFRCFEVKEFAILPPISGGV